MANYVETDQAVLRYLGDDSTTEFDITFNFYDDEDLVVYVDEELQELGTDYEAEESVEGTGTITFYTAPSLDVDVVIFREARLERLYDFATNSRFKFDQLDDDLDQQLRQVSDNRLNNTSIKAPGYKVGDFNGEIEGFEAGKLLAINETGDGVVAQDAEESDVLSGVVDELKTYTDQAEADANTYTDEVAATTLTSAKTYTDQEMAGNLEELVGYT